VLKHVDISDLGLDKRMMRIILKSVKKNVNLKSINFGHIEVPEIQELIDETAAAPALRCQSLPIKSEIEDQKAAYGASRRPT